MSASTDNSLVYLYTPADLIALTDRGVLIPAPEQVAIAREVALEHIAAGAVLHPFCRISGGRTRIGAGAVIGGLGPVTLQDTVCGPGTVLGCGVAEDAVFLGREEGGTAFNTGYGFRVRKGSLYEEGARSAQHSDTKMTILFPWATLGSNTNFCDVLLAGGTGQEPGEFSEVGSGAIHFNFTPRGDKATASAFGNVVQGVFLDQPRLFLGGNGSLIGPLRAAFGAITGAGARHGGALAAGLNSPAPPPAAAEDFHLEIYGSIKRVYESQVRYVGELAALDAWYGQARALLAADDAELETLYAGGRRMVALNIAERIAQLGALAGRMERSAHLLEQRAPGDPRIAQQRALHEGWGKIETQLQGHGGRQEEMPSALRQGLEQAAAGHGRVYTRVIRALPAEAVAAGRAWLGAVRDGVASRELLDAVPELSSVRMAAGGGRLA